jgi:hypothetical protein
VCLPRSLPRSLRNKARSLGLLDHLLCQLARTVNSQYVLPSLFRSMVDFPSRKVLMCLENEVTNEPCGPTSAVANSAAQPGDRCDLKPEIGSKAISVYRAAQLSAKALGVDTERKMQRVGQHCAATIGDENACSTVASRTCMWPATQPACMSYGWRHTRRCAGVMQLHNGCDAHLLSSVCGGDCICLVQAVQPSRAGSRSQETPAQSVQPHHGAQHRAQPGWKRAAVRKTTTG